MIEGLKFYMPSAELREHLMARIDHHTERAAWYGKKADELTAGGVVAAQMTGGDPVAGLKAKEKEHEHHVSMFTFMRDHIAPDEQYQLKDEDLQRLEILKRHW